MAKRLIAVAALSALVLLLAACGVGGEKDPIDLVPARAELLASLDLPAILADPDVADAYELIAQSMGDEEMPATLDALLAFAEEKSGLDLSQFGQVVFFVDLPSSDSDDIEYAAVIAAGAPDGLLETVMASAPDEFTQSERNGVTVLESTDGEAQLTVVEGSAVFGTVAAVGDVLAIGAGNGTALSGDVLDFYNEFGDVWVRAAVVLPADLMAELANMDGGDLGLPVNLGDLLNIAAIGLSLDKSGSDATSKLVLRYPTVEQAEKAKETIEAFITLMTTFAPDEAMLESFESLEFTLDGADLVMESTENVQESMDQLREFLETFGTGSMGMGF